MQHGSIYFAHRPALDPVGQKVKIQPFPEHGQVSYQIKWNHQCGNIVAHILPRDIFPGPWGWGQKV